MIALIEVMSTSWTFNARKEKMVSTRMQDVSMQEVHHPLCNQTLKALKFVAREEARVSRQWFDQDLFRKNALRAMNLAIL